MSNATNSETPLEILVVEDNPGDVRLFLNEFQHIELLANFYVETNGIDACKFLHHEGKYSRSPRPDLIVLDLNLPRKSGLEILKEINSNENLNNIPIIIFTSMPYQKEIQQKCQNIRKQIFLPKPQDLDGYKSVVESVEKFWHNKQ